MNQYHWIGVLADRELSKLLDPAEADSDPYNYLSLPANFDGKIGSTVDDTRQRHKVHAQWRRLLSLVMIASALERYLSDVCHLAIAADPLLVAGWPKVLDGALLRKRELLMPERSVESVTKGDWSQRSAAFAKLFGSVPGQISDSMSDLEFLRRTRNTVAHALGSMNEVADSASLLVLDLAIDARLPHIAETVRVSDRRVLKLQGVCQAVVDAVDDQLLSQNIGAFELVSLYLEWQVDPSAFEERTTVTLGRHNNPQDRFQNVVGALFGTTPGKHFIRDLIRYCNSL